jgi:hypothetical protein
LLRINSQVFFFYVFFSTKGNNTATYPFFHKDTNRPQIE